MTNSAPPTPRPSPGCREFLGVHLMFCAEPVAATDFYGFGYCKRHASERGL